MFNLNSKFSCFLCLMIFGYLYFFHSLFRLWGTFARTFVERPWNHCRIKFWQPLYMDYERMNHQIIFDLQLRMLCWILWNSQNIILAGRFAFMLFCTFGYMQMRNALSARHVPPFICLLVCLLVHFNCRTDLKQIRLLQYALIQFLPWAFLFSLPNPFLQAFAQNARCTLASMTHHHLF